MICTVIFISIESLRMQKSASIRCFKIIEQKTRMLADLKLKWYEARRLKKII